jgi:glycosyltransferase involved in cell wall biosynthesis
MAGPDHSGTQAQLMRLAERLGIAPAVTWTGMLHGDLKAGAFRAAEVFVLPSHQENFGVAVAEALSCSTPVLISNQVNIWREILDERAGLVAEDTLQGTQQLLSDWLALNSEERQQMTRNAAECFQRRFHVDKLARKLPTLFMLRESAAT